MKRQLFLIILIFVGMLSFVFAEDYSGEASSYVNTYENDSGLLIDPVYSANYENALYILIIIIALIVAYFVFRRSKKSK